jgi:hypothetical protein
VQNRLAAGENVETHLNNLLFLNAIKSDCLELPNRFSNDPVQHSKVEVDIEVFAVSVLDGKYLFLDVLKVFSVKILLVELTFLAAKLHYAIVVMLPQLFELPVLLDQAFQSLINAEQFGL